MYNYLDGPCYRCLYSKAPLPETVSNCSDAGILGPVVGTIGSMQALETIKILSQVGTSLSGRMLIFDGLDFQTRIIKLRPRQVDTCPMCMPQPGLSREKIAERLDKFDYNLFCGVSNYNDKSLNINILDETSQRVTCMQYRDIISTPSHDKIGDEDSHLLIDVRPECQFKICALPKSLSRSYTHTNKKTPKKSDDEKWD